MHRPCYIILVFAGLAQVGLAQTSGTRLTCDRRETDALKESPLGAIRAHKDTLVVRWLGGSATFADSGQVAGDLAGIGYKYCGFSSTGFHLIHKHDEFIFDGILLDYRTGKILPAGYDVIFSPLRTAYLAVVQPDGMDGQEWFLYSIDGTRLWKGESNVIGRPDGITYDAITGTLDDPRFTSSGQLQVTRRCSLATPPTVLTLVQRADKWNWSPGATCPHK